MKNHKPEVSFDPNRRSVLAVLYSFIGLALLFICFFSIRIIRDTANLGYERVLVMGEPAPASDQSRTPPREVLKLAGGLEDKAYRVRVDENGYIMPSGVHPKADASIVFLGGSTTQCLFMAEEERFPPLVGRQLDTALEKKVNTFNSGHAGNNTQHSLLLLQGKVLAQKPTLAVLMECLNDLNTLMAAGGSPNAGQGLLQDKQYNPFRTFIIRHFVERRPGGPSGGDEFAAAAGKDGPPSMAELSRLHRLNLEHFIFLCRQHGITPVLMTQCNRLTEELPPNLAEQLAPTLRALGIPYADYRARYQALNETARQVAREWNVLLIDLDVQVPKTSDAMYDLVHLNAKGARLVADITAKALEPELREILAKGRQGQ